MERVIIESPFAGDVDRNLRYARAAMRDCLLRGESPYASHLLYTQPGVLNDDIPDERKHGIDAGLAWAQAVATVVVYQDLGVSRGMSHSIDIHLKAGRTVLYRNLPGWG